MVKNQLSQITNWLKKNAPRIEAYSLNKPATEEDISRLKKITKEIPSDFLDLYRTHNGINDHENWGNFFYGMLFFSIDEIIADQDFRTSQSKNTEPITLKNCDPEIDGTNFYNLNWIGFASDGARSNLRLDLSPSEKGTYGQVIFVDGDYNTALLVAPSIADLLNDFAKDLESGLYTLSAEALEDGQHFLEPDQTIDIGNWHHIDKWKKYI
jgi:cell wall assembly regulator SMI1